MRKILFTLPFIILSFFYSCSSDNSTDSNEAESPQPIACFELSSEEVILGEEITIKNCSQNATNIKFTYNNQGENITITDLEFSVEFSTPGEYQITLEVSNEQGIIDNTSKTVTVLGIEANFKYFDYPIGVEGIPAGFGINENTNTFYFLEFNRDHNTNNLRRKILYKELNNEYSINKNFFIDNVVGSLFFRHCIKMENGKNQNVFIPLIPTPYPPSSPIYTLDENGNLINKEESSLNVTHGNIEFNGNHAYYGGIQENIGDFIAPAIQVRNTDNLVIETKKYDIGLKDAFIGDLIKSSSGYIGFGGSFTGDTSIINYIPTLYFFDNNLELTKHKEFNDTSLTMVNLSIFSIATWFHVEELNSGNLVTYGLNEMIITDSNGDKINSHFFDGNRDSPQGLVNLGDSFIISTRDFLRKFDASGSEIKNVFFDGDITPKFILENNNIFFVSGYNKSETTDSNIDVNISKIFMGAFDKDLNFVNLNN